MRLTRLWRWMGVAVALYMLLPGMVRAQKYGAGAVIDLAEASLVTQRVALEGPWEFYPFMLLDPGDKSDAYETVTLPHLWNQADAALGFASYRTVLVIPSSLVRQRLSLYMPDVYASYRLFIDGKEVGTNGKVGIRAAETIPEWRPQVLSFTPAQDSVEMVVQVANFHHHRGGIGKRLKLAEASFMQTHVSIVEKTSGGLILLLVIIALVSVGFCCVYHDHIYLAFALLCITWGVRVAFSNHYLGVHYFQDIPWHWVVRIEYITLYMTTLFGLLFVAALFPDDFNRMFILLYGIISLVFTGFTLGTPPLVFTAYIHGYLLFSIVLLIVIVLILIKAFVRDRRGSNSMAGCVLIGVLLFGYIILAYHNVVVFNELIFSFGFFVVFLLTALSAFSKTLWTAPPPQTFLTANRYYEMDMRNVSPHSPIAKHEDRLTNGFIHKRE